MTEAGDAGNSTYKGWMTEIVSAKAATRAATTRAAQPTTPNADRVRTGGAATEGERTADDGDVAEAWKATGEEMVEAVEAEIFT